MNFIEGLGKINAYVGLYVGSILLIALSLIYPFPHINLWLEMLLYSMAGFGNSVVFKKQIVIQRVISVVLFAAFVLTFVQTAVESSLYMGVIGSLLGY